MASATITKAFTFHAAHVLPNHDGLCSSLHGHTYRVEVSVSGWIKGPNGDADEGMVIDFTVIKNIYKDMIEPLVEHKFLNDTLRNVLPTTEDDQALTTSENLAVWLHGVFMHALNTLHVSVAVWETETSCARVGSIH